MKIVEKYTFKIVFAFAIFIYGMGVQPAQAQISFDDDVDDEVPAAPIDGLIGLGIASGTLYGIRKLKEKK